MLPVCSRKMLHLPDERIAETYDTAQAAAVLGVSVRTLKRLAREGRIPTRKVGRAWRFSPAALEAWLAPTPAFNTALPWAQYERLYHYGDAHALTAEAEARGDIQRTGVCAACGVAGETQLHHADYSRPLDTRELCERCHGVEHAGRVGSGRKPGRPLPLWDAAVAAWKAAHGSCGAGDPAQVVVIRKTRSALGLTQEQLANALSVHSMSVSKWERGILVPDVRDAAVFAGLAQLGDAELSLLGTTIKTALAQAGSLAAYRFLLDAAIPRGGA